MNNVEPIPPLMTAVEFRVHYGLAQYVTPPPVIGEPQEEQPTQKDIFEDLELENGPQLELKRDIPWNENTEEYEAQPSDDSASAKREISKADGGVTPLSTFDKWTADTPRASAAAFCVIPSFSRT